MKFYIFKSRILYSLGIYCLNIGLGTNKETKQPIHQCALISSYHGKLKENIFHELHEPRICNIG